MRFLSLGSTLVALCCFAIGCSKKDSSNDATSSTAPSAPFLVAADVAKPSTVDEVAAADIASELSSDSDFYNNQPESTEADTACGTLSDAVTITATATQAVIAAVLDVGACLKTDSSSDTLTVSSASGTSTYYAILTCTAGDVSSLNGKKLGDLDSDQTFAACSSMTKLLHLKMDASLAATASGQAISMKFATRSTTGTADLAPCTGTSTGANGATTSSCVHISTETTETTVGQKTTTSGKYSKYVGSDVVEDNNNTAVWPKSGKQTVTYANWTGTLTYVSATTAPTYSLTSSAGKTLSGSLTAQSFRAEDDTVGLVEEHPELLLARRVRNIEDRLNGQLRRAFKLD